MNAGHEGVYHADNGDQHAVLAEAGDGEAESTDFISVLAGKNAGSGLEPGWNSRDAKRGDKVGEWSPA